MCLLKSVSATRYSSAHTVHKKNHNYKKNQPDINKSEEEIIIFKNTFLND